MPEALTFRPPRQVLLHNGKVAAAGGGLSQQRALIKATMCVIEMLGSIKSLNPTDLVIHGLNLNAEPRVGVHRVATHDSPASAGTGPAEVETFQSFFGRCTHQIKP